MIHYILILILVTGCAQVGPVEITEDDTIFTVLTAFLLAVAIFLIKGYIEYQFAKRLEKFKRKLDKK